MSLNSFFLFKGMNIDFQDKMFAYLRLVSSQVNMIIVCLTTIKLDLRLVQNSINLSSY